MLAETMSIKPGEWMNMRYDFEASGIYQVVLERDSKNEFELLAAKIANSFCSVLRVVPTDYVYSIDHMIERFAWESPEFEVIIDGKEQKQMELMISWYVNPRRDFKTNIITNSITSTSITSSSINNNNLMKWY